MTVLMKNKSKRGYILNRIKDIAPPFFLSRSFFVCLGAFVLSLVAVLGNLNVGTGTGNLEEFEVGRVAERDIIADVAVSYQDLEATRIRQEARERLVSAVFHYDNNTSSQIINNWDRFSSMVISLSSGTRENFINTIQDEYMFTFPVDMLHLLYNNSALPDLMNQSRAILTWIVESGIFYLPISHNFETYNPLVLELVRSSGTRIEREMILYNNIITMENAEDAIISRLASNTVNSADFYLIASITKHFLVNNVFFSREETLDRIMEVRSNTEPVMNYIERGKHIIRRGFIITEDDMVELRALNMSRAHDLRIIFARFLLLFLVFVFLMFFCGKRVIGRSLSEQEILLICILSVIYIAAAVLARNFTWGTTSISVSLIIPTALIIMLPSILIHPRLALLLSLALPLAAFFSDSFDEAAFIFALVSGVTSSFVLHHAQKRMDLLKAGLIIAAANCVVIVAIMLGQRIHVSTFPVMIFWAAFNGIASGMLVLGFLPPLEQLLSAATSFKLIELSDLNAPLLRRLFTIAPGTYNHSIMVANLAESACQEIGANALLARVGAYYHDIGKIENPNYFVENQGEYNPHDEITPRHSVSILRNHVKLGIEKARQLKLPRDVMNIIADHHGSSLIAWFYSKALNSSTINQDVKETMKSPVNMDDYSYQGSPPHTRESAVVMLADMTEAAVRALQKPTVQEIEKRINELIASKIEQKQLAQSELTYKDMEIIKKTFINVLMSYHHSRIEYPKIELPKDESSPQDSADKKEEDI